MSLKVTHSKDYHNFLSIVIENELSVDPPNNEVLWVKMGTQLEIEGIPDKDISTIIKKDIEDKLYEKQPQDLKDYTSRVEFSWHSGHYFRVMQKHRWTNPNMARNIAPLREQEIVPYANSEMKTLCYDIINLCKILIEKSKNNIPFEELFGKKKMQEFYKQSHTVINNCKNAIDHKTKVPKNTEIFLLEYLGTILGSTNKCAEMFMEQNLMRLKKQGKFFTLKQATKFQKGMKQSQQFILKPSSRDAAIFLDYVGVQCVCGSFRVRQKADSYKLECYDCSVSIPQGHISKCNNCRIPLYKERLLHIVKTNRCENCNEIVDLPQELVDFAQS